MYRNRVGGDAVLVACEPVEAGTLVSLKPELHAPGTPVASSEHSDSGRLSEGDRNDESFRLYRGRKEILPGIGEPGEPGDNRNLFRFFWLRGLDLNQRPLGYEPNELPDCSTPHLDSSNRSP